jgi:hypothetical protein
MSTLDPRYLAGVETNFSSGITEAGSWELD